MNTTWHTSAPCASADPDAWFPEKGEHAAAAKAICRACPYRQLCLEEAIAWGPDSGVWGEKTVNEIHRIRQERGLVPATAALPEAPSNGACRFGHDTDEMHVKPGGKRQCRACNRDHVRASRKRKRANLAGAATMARALDETFGEDAA